MQQDRFDHVLDRLDALLAATDDEARRRDIREIQQLVIGAASTCEADQAAARTIEALEER